jgi:3'(2'), 5'-bisphosphate nucleotidase
MINSSAEYSLADLLPQVVALAREAGASVMAIYETGNVDVQIKKDASPLTQADLASHRIIVAGLSLLTTDWPILSEESKEIPFEQRSAWQRYWLVDPLDGTKEFINRTGEFTVNIALIENGFPILGVVYAPVIERMYFALAGSGAFREIDGKESQVKACAYKDGTVRIVASRSHRGEKLDTFLARIGEHETVSMGSSLKLCLVAEGRADLYPRLGPTMEWDTAAAQCIVEVAGGAVEDINGIRLRYNKPDLLNPEFVVSGNPPFLWRSYI